MDGDCTMTRERVATGDLFAQENPIAPIDPCEYPPSLDDAHALGAVSQAAVQEHADNEWLASAGLWVIRLPVGARFIAEDVVIGVEALGHSTHNRKAVGPVIASLARAGVIEKTGAARAARTSHGSLKPEWVRL